MRVVIISRLPGHASHAEYALPDGCRIAEALERIPLGPWRKDMLLVVRNGKACLKGDTLRPGDTVELVPLLSGG